MTVSKLARQLLECDANIHARNDEENDEGNTPLQVASAPNHQATVELLLQYGAEES